MADDDAGSSPPKKKQKMVPCYTCGEVGPLPSFLSDYQYCTSKTEDPQKTTARAECCSFLAVNRRSGTWHGTAKTPAATTADHEDMWPRYAAWVRPELRRISSSSAGEEEKEKEKEKEKEERTKASRLRPGAASSGDLSFRSARRLPISTSMTFMMAGSTLAADAWLLHSSDPKASGTTRR